jgi:hypothetical protein
MNDDSLAGAATGSSYGVSQSDYDEQDPAKDMDVWEVVIAAVAQNGRALQFASAEIKNDKEVVLAAVAQDRSALELSLIAPGEFQSFVRGGLVAHQTCVAFLLAAHPHETSLLRAATAPHPASWVLDGVGEDAGRHVRQLIAAFAGAPCGQGWVVTRAAEQNS